MQVNVKHEWKSTVVVDEEDKYYTTKFVSDLKDTEYEKIPHRKTVYASKIKQIEDPYGGITPDATL